MLFLNDHIKKRKSYTNVSSVKQSKNEVMENTACTQLASTASMTRQRDIHDSNLSINSDITANLKPPAPNSTSQISNSKDELIRPYTNFVTCKKNVLQCTGPALSAIALDNDSVTGSNSSRRCIADIPHSLDELDEMSRSSISFRESTPSSGSSVTQATLLSRKSSIKKIKNDSFQLENSLLSLCETISQNLQGNRNPEVDGNWNEAFAKLVVHLLDRLPLNEQLKRQQSMLKILYETGASQMRTLTNGHSQPQHHMIRDILETL
ncbi:uncharacterized protein LOC116843679 [Odontomachus brunneus]|uniref:uncharacterized protein LOC116843679 n=1 Tax=Odontomachus brunneus TaxID=486640 RepID=UPI0013F2A5EE|nr:uncharacterized protein LOC116843679 [Odontomachus brunneus]XP_032670191.1 uncharacterized protein LOC116843679 [Odontomachus brunneus]XP_032670192.1 uncharacterized protein LOC116843679 [Odontomachus brunneus]XP_032670193.1 uncharacterized protein LOC116843679 [Odontomachus brunneus]XP_032670194.1 uncharacterized protein LOC116843679 [Odontomachus brunneus]XP_032670195.1 uncharacterized protein LOC116843679 [Odontomachus brunneus]XP_032670196.1 uncharacterized protein LOC116843679 [Odonto